MPRSFFAMMPGVPTPAQFKPVQCELSLLADLWGQARAARPSLIFRARSDKEPGDILGPEDQLESCVGVLDSAVRWRVSFKVAGALLQAIRHPGLLDACQRAFAAVAGTHPAGFAQNARTALLASIRDAMEKMDLPRTPGEKAQAYFEQQVAVQIMHLVGSDNDIEAAHAVPQIDMLTVDIDPEDKSRLDSRLATIETMMGSALLSEAYGRLTERLPMWLYSPMPALSVDSGQPENPSPRRGMFSRPSVADRADDPAEQDA